MLSIIKSKIKRIIELAKESFSLLITSGNYLRNIELLKGFRLVALWIVLQSLFPYLLETFNSMIVLVLSPFLIILYYLVYAFLFLDYLYNFGFKAVGISFKKTYSLKEKSIITLSFSLTSILAAIGSFFTIYNIKYFLLGLIGLICLFASFLPGFYTTLIGLILLILSLIFILYWLIGVFIHYIRLLYSPYFVLFENGILSSLKLSWDTTASNYKSIGVIIIFLLIYLSPPLFIAIYLHPIINILFDLVIAYVLTFFYLFIFKKYVLKK